MKILSFQKANNNSGFSKECRFCRIACKLIFSGELVSRHMDQNKGYKIAENNPYSMFIGGITNFNVYQCLRCGWWSFFHQYITEMGTVLPPDSGSAILKEFDATDLDLPMDVLRSEVEKSGKLLHHIHPKKMEELVGSILKDFLNVEVEYVGASHDRGIDLLLLKGDLTIPVQVKRRTTLKKTETFRTVREMQGVLFSDNYRNAYIVSTADHFSREAIKETNKVLHEGKCDSFELVDYHRFLDMIDVVKPLAEPSWAQSFRDHVNTRELNYYLQYMYKEKS